MDEHALPDDLERQILALFDLPEDRRDAAFTELYQQHPRYADRIRERLARTRTMLRDLDASVPGGAGHPREIGPFHILGVLGEGGMGTVYLAEQQEPVRRRVALKLIKVGMDSRRALARFETEFHALAMMTHPGIARMFEAAVSERGRPYFAMEYVPGEPLTDFCDHHALDIPARLELFQRVCLAVQHAHQKGVIHRDLKPSNVLVTQVDGEPQPVVIDFGLARAIAHGQDAESLYTQPGAVIGTPEYMSPEQAESAGCDLDTRTDVYALGVILYELLVGERPFDRDAGLTELQRRIREDEPGRPSTRVGTRDDSADQRARERGTDRVGLAGRLRGDLDWITLKALEKDRDRRYQSAAELAADVGRHLDHEPVHAGPASLGYRLHKLVRRHRVEVAAGVAVFLALSLGLIASTALYLDARAARARSQVRAEQAERVTDFLVDLFDYASPSKSLGERMPVGLVLQRGVQQIRGELGDQPEIRARLLGSLGRVYSGLGSYQTAEELLSEALETVPVGELEVAEELYLRQLLGVVLADRGHYREAEPMIEETLARARHELGPRHAVVADCLAGLGALRQRLGRLDEAERDLAAAVQIHRAAGRGDSVVVVIALGSLAGVLHDAGQRESSRDRFDEALALAARTFPKGHPAVVGVLANSARPLLALGEHQLAEQRLEQARREADRMFGPQHPYVVHLAVQRANFLSDLGRDREAESVLRHAVATVEKVLGDDHPDLGWILNDLGMLLVRLDRNEEGREVLVRARDIFRAAYDGDHLHLAICIGNLGNALMNLGQLQRAEELARESLAMRRRLGRVQPDGGIEVARGTRQLAWVLVFQNRLDEAKETLDRAIEVVGDLPSHRGERSQLRSLLAHVHNRLGHGAESEAEGLRALELLRRDQPGDRPDQALCLYNLGWACLLQGQRDRAEPWFLQSIAMYRRLSPDGCRDLAFPLGHLGAALVPDRAAEALPLLEEALELRRRFFASGHFWVVQTVQALAVAHVALEQFAAAEPLYLEAYAALQQSRGERDPVTDKVREQLVRLYESWGQPDKAAEHRKGRETPRPRDRSPR